MNWLTFPCRCKLRREAKTFNQTENEKNCTINSCGAGESSQKSDNIMVNQQPQLTKSVDRSVSVVPQQKENHVVTDSEEPTRQRYRSTGKVKSCDNSCASFDVAEDIALDDQHAAPPSVLAIPFSSSGDTAPMAATREGRMLRRKTTPANLLMSTAKLSNALSKVAEDSDLEESYRNIPLLEMAELPRGGIIIKTKAVGNVQYGIPPETIKDSMRLGLDVPCVYIVPVERFSREMGPALGVNLAEFEFPAYFNFFVQRRRCTLIVDNMEAERNIQKVFSETLLGPALFRRNVDPIAYQEEDFDPSFPREAIPNFAKELKHFRMMPNGEELRIETLLKFSYFETLPVQDCMTKLATPPPLDEQAGLVKVNSDTEMRDNFRSQRRMSIKAIRDAQVKSTRFASNDESNKDTRKTWTYSQVKWAGDVAAVYETNITPEQMASGKCKRVEIFKMSDGAEYVLHDIDEHNRIIGKARFLGQIRVPELVSVIDFKSQEDSNREEQQQEELEFSPRTGEPYHGRYPHRGSLPGLFTPTFHPPSFGVTVLGNSHGFDKSGSTSGYVLWINGRGIMIDPPPYSSATLEREGIRPRTIVGIILTHCHADHDAGAFQKVLTGSPVVVITTPTIYESFIRKYAALSALSPALLRHSHRYKRAIVGQALRFQGATFYFTYTLHSIPCVGFRVEWRGRSMVFTGDHMNIPSQIDMLQEKGVLTKARADDLRNLPLQETDLLLHESGAPPIHTPLEELLKLPSRVKARLYVVHTSALPPGCELRVAPTGTAGTIRLDQLTSKNHVGRNATDSSFVGHSALPSAHMNRSSIGSIQEMEENEGDFFEALPPTLSEYNSVNKYSLSSKNFGGQIKLGGMIGNQPPLVALRPTSSTDAWFILNLLSAVPFMSSLSYASTMEVLETARVDAFCLNDIVVSASRRRDVLCVVWEGACVEREQEKNGMALIPKEKMRRVQNAKAREAKRRFADVGEVTSQVKTGAVWYAGDWTGPRSLQPEKRLSGESSLSRTHDIVAKSSEGVKVITIEFANLHAILQSGSARYRTYLARKRQQAATDSDVECKDESAVLQMQKEAMKNLNIIELLDNNSTFRKLNAVQKRHLESLAEGPLYYAPGQRLWRSGQQVDKAFIVVAGTVAFVAKRRSAHVANVSAPLENSPNATKASGGDGCNHGNDSAINLGNEMQIAVVKAVKELKDPNFIDDESTGSNGSIRHEKGGKRHANAIFHSSQRAYSPASTRQVKRRSSGSSLDDVLLDLNDFAVRDDSGSEHGEKIMEDRRKAKDRLASKVLGRLNNRRANTAGLVFSRGTFLGDVSKMVARLLSYDYDGDKLVRDDEDSSFAYGFGDTSELSVDRTRRSAYETIHEAESDRLVVHNSTLAAGNDGCSVIVFPKSSLIPFLDEYPGLLLSLLGTQVVV